MEELSNIFLKSIGNFMVSEDLVAIKSVVLVFLIFGILCILKDLLFGRKKTKSQIMLKQIRKQQKDEYEKMQDRIEEDLVLMETDLGNYTPRSKKELSENKGFSTQNDTYIKLFGLIDETMGYDKVCELLGMDGTLQAQSGNKRNYIWYLGWYPIQKYDEYNRMELLKRTKSNIIFVFALFALISPIFTISLGVEVLLASLFGNLVLTALLVVLLELMTNYLLSVFQMKQGVMEEVYIRVSFVDGRVYSKEQKGLKSRGVRRYEK